jgi:predicted PurR-regulated permease PerM
VPEEPPAHDDRRADRGILARDRRLADEAEEADDAAEPERGDAEPAGADTTGPAGAESTTAGSAAGTGTGTGQTGAGQAGPGQAGADQPGPGQSGAGRSTANQATANQATTGQATADQVTANQVATDQVTAGQAATGQAGAGEVVSHAGNVAEPDPVTDMAARVREAGVDERFPFGRPGRPLTKSHPFVFGFYGALGVLAAYMLVQALTNARQVIILIIVALFLAVGLNPGVEALERIGISRRWAVLVVFLTLVGFFVGFGFAIVPPLSEQTTAIIHNLTSGNGYLEQLQRNPRLQDWDHRYHLLQKARTALQNKDLGTRAANGVVGVGQVVLSGVFSTLTVLILTLYFLSSLPNITGFMYRLAPRSRRARVALLGDEILTRIGGYVAGNLLISLIAGVTTYIFLLIVGVPYALALALLVAITDLIPLVGATIGAIFVTAIAFFSGFWVGIAALIFFAIYQQVENYIVQPRVMKRSVDVQPAVTIIAALIGGTLLGVIGALLAIPAAAAIALILREVVMPRQEQV